MERKAASGKVTRLKMVRSLTVALGWVLFTRPDLALCAQSAGYELAQKLIPNVVLIRAKRDGKTEDGGFGFIVGERDGLLYIVTANHVVRGSGSPGEADPSPTVLFSLFQGSPYRGKLLQRSSSSADLAVISVESAQLARVVWTRESLSAAHTIDQTPVWFVGREQKWFIPTSPGTVSSITEVKRNEYSGPTIVVQGLQITGGTSGAPLLSVDGIIGMIVSDSSTQEVEAIPIERIEILMKEWMFPWDVMFIPPKQNCDRLAASPYDNDRPTDVPGIDLENIDSANASDACFNPFLAYSTRIPRFAFEMGRAREAGNRLKEAEQGYFQAANAGYAAAQSSLGWLYERQNKEQDAAELYRRAADHGDPMGQTKLGIMLRDEYGGQTQDDGEAVKLFKEAAGRGYPMALSCLAWMYEQGRGGLPKSEAEAQQLYRQAAAKGELYAQRALARLGF